MEWWWWWSGQMGENPKTVSQGTLIFLNLSRPITKVGITYSKLKKKKKRSKCLCLEYITRIHIKLIWALLKWLATLDFQVQERTDRSKQEAKQESTHPLNNLHRSASSPPPFLNSKTASFHSPVLVWVQVITYVAGASGNSSRHPLQVTFNWLGLLYLSGPYSWTSKVTLPVMDPIHISSNVVGSRKNKKLQWV